MVIILLRRTLGFAYEAGRVLDGLVTAGTLDNAYAAVLERRAQSRAHAALKTEEDRELAHPA
jgi:hypothetical protein